MSPVWVQRIVGVILIGHGIGHGMGILAAFGISLSDSHSLNSWAFTSVLGNKPAIIIGVMIYLAAIACFIATGLGLLDWLVSYNNWQTYASAAAIISLVGLLLYWNAYPFFIPNKAGVILVDTFVLLSVHMTHWPSQLYYLAVT